MAAFLVILLPLIIYLIGAFSVAEKNVKNPDDFFLAFKKVGITAFSSSSIAYNFQVSTIYPFLLWGASGIYLIPIVNTFCAGLGIFIFYLCYPKYKRFIGRDTTLHGFLGDSYGSPVRFIASYLTIIAFLGFAISETYFGSKVLLSIINDQNIFYGIVAGALLFVYGYISYGGQISSIRTDQLQLIISYIGVFGIMLYFLFLLINNPLPIPQILSWGLLTVCIYIVFILILRRFRFIKFNETESLTNKIINITSNAIVVLTFILLFFTAAYLFLTKPITQNEHSFFNLQGFGICGLLSLIFLPLSFQFVDLTNWQRILSVKGDPLNKTGLERNIKRGLLTYAVESPFTWVIFIFFGLLTISALPNIKFNDLLIDIPKQLIASSTISNKIVGYTFIVSIISIMLSTIDSFIMGMIFTFVYDSYPKTREWLDNKEESANIINFKPIIDSGRLFGLIAVLSGIILFIVFDENVVNGGELFINLLLSFYTAQLAFLPHILGILFLKTLPSTKWAVISMLVGSGVGIFSGVYSVLFNPNWAWYPILLCLFLSFTIYFLGLIFKKLVF